MKERVEFELAHPRDGVYVTGWSGALRTGPARWTFLVPEIGRLCRAYAPKVQESLVGRYIDTLRPSWALAWGILAEYGHEKCTGMVLHTMSHFQAKAYLAETPNTELLRAIDVPWCRADLYYVQKTAISLRVGKPERWISLRMK